MDEDLQELRAYVEEGIRDLDEGRYIELDDESLKELFDDIVRRGRARLSES